jgi:hypothetical protein
MTSQRMPRVGDFYFCWKPAGVILQCVTDFKDDWGLTPLRVRRLPRVTLHADLTILAQLADAVVRSSLASAA